MWGVVEVWKLAMQSLLACACFCLLSHASDVVFWASKHSAHMIGCYTADSASSGASAFQMSKVQLLYGSNDYNVVVITGSATMMRILLWVQNKCLSQKVVHMSDYLNLNQENKVQHLLVATFWLSHIWFLNLVSLLEEPP